MAGKITGGLDDSPSGGKTVGSLDHPADDAVDAAETDPSAYTSPSSSTGDTSSSYDYDDSSSGGYGGGSSDNTSGDSHADEPSADDDAGGEDTDLGNDDSDPDADTDSTFRGEAESDDSDGTSDGDEDDEPESEDPEPEDNDNGDSDSDSDSDSDNDGNDDGQNDDGGNRKPGVVSIDIQAMTMLIAAMERARDQIPEYETELRGILTDVGLDEVDALNAPRFSQVTAWLEDELPGLRRRLALAQEIEDGGFHALPDRQPHSPRQPVRYDEGRVLQHSPHVSMEHGQAAVTLFASRPDHNDVKELIAKLNGNQHDPYFAHTFTSEADPAAVTAAIDAARTQDDVDPAQVDQLANLIETTLRTARRGTGELAPEEGFEDQWAEVTGSGHPSAS
ncbi:hypothetical protein [Phytoactinopolyspora endophytica]|uniref:hypothetical protein n=1 Tax=Phytoactinopolyspora endophytica TaxID=1642495 RepID=UPI00101BE867|nr:hypothetical protein [Phytoactinopolyspora endophytica]